MAQLALQNQETVLYQTAAQRLAGEGWMVFSDDSEIMRQLDAIALCWSWNGEGRDYVLGNDQVVFRPRRQKPHDDS